MVRQYGSEIMDFKGSRQVAGNGNSSRDDVFDNTNTAIMESAAPVAGVIAVARHPRSLSNDF